MPVPHIALIAAQGSLFAYWSLLALRPLRSLWRAAAGGGARAGWRARIRATLAAAWAFAAAPEHRRDRNRLILIKLLLVAMVVAETALPAAH